MCQKRHSRGQHVARPAIESFYLDVAEGRRVGVQLVDVEVREELPLGAAEYALGVGLWAMIREEVIYCLVWPLVVMVVLRSVSTRSMRVAIIAYVVGSSSGIMKFMLWKELSFLAWQRIRNSSATASRESEACECVVVSSRIDDNKAPDICMACNRARRRYYVVSPLVLLIVGRGRRYGECTSSAVLHHEFQAPTPRRWDRMRGGLLENLMTF